MKRPAVSNGVWKCTTAVAALCSIAFFALPGCYERVIRTKQGSNTTEVAQPDFKEEPGAWDELMWGPVPKGQDPSAYYAKKKRLLAQ